jgi:hypothetical protein
MLMCWTLVVEILAFEGDFPSMLALVFHIKKDFLSISVESVFFL